MDCILDNYLLYCDEQAIFAMNGIHIPTYVSNAELIIYFTKPPITIFLISSPTVVDYDPFWLLLRVMT